MLGGVLVWGSQPKSPVVQPRVFLFFMVLFFVVPIPASGPATDGRAGQNLIPSILSQRKVKPSPANIGSMKINFPSLGISNLFRERLNGG
jgi:hypothetical protein